MSDCIFCKIANKEINTELVYESEKVVAFKDINPKAPIHVLVIPKKHIETVMDIKDEDKEIISDMYKAIREIAKELNIDEKGFRIITNCKEDGGQEVMHLHMHMLAGKKLSTNII
ncbi:MAG: histidine triad nucleotide-binding protein [Clostridia bacterium]|nr:histidine triad nucleotide-binding protein [Clostridia bacterium]